MVPTDFSFSASGWLMQWQLGVAYALQRHGIGHSSRARFVGASGGAAVSSALALDVDARLVGDYMVRCCADFHQHAPVRRMWRMRDYAESCIRRVLDESTHEREALRDGRLNVQITLLPSCRGVIVSDFHSADYFCKVVLASCTMSPVAGMPFQLRSADPALDGAWVCDGGVTAIQPVLGKDTVTISPIHFMAADIAPSRYVPAHWAVFPPSPEEFTELFWLGAHDAMQWLHAQGLGLLADDGTACPRAAVHRLRVTERPRVDDSWRIKPLLTRKAVSQHRSHDGISISSSSESESSGSSTSTTSTSNGRRRPSQQQVPPVNRHVRGRSRANSWSSSGSAVTLDSFSSERVQRIISDDEARAGAALGWRREALSRVKDSVTVAAVATCVKPLALSIVYTELWSRAALSTAGAALAAIEHRRRAARQASPGWLSVRRWVHDGMLGTAAESLASAKSCAAAAVDPAGLLQHVPVLGKRLVSDPSASQEKLRQHSLAYRWLATTLPL